MKKENVKCKTQQLVSENTNSGWLLADAELSVNILGIRVGVD